MAIVTNSENMINNNKVDDSGTTEVAYDFPPKVLVQKEGYTSPVTKDGSTQATFQGAMKLIILIGQCFGLNPVLGICEKDTSKLRFTVRSVRCVYTILSLIGQCWVVCLCLLKLAKQENQSLGSNSNLVFYATNTVTTFLFLRVAMKWPKLCQQISKLEASEPNMDAGIVKKCNITCIFVLFLALLEHIFSDMTAIVVVIDCQPDTNLVEAFFRQCYTWAWMFFNYSNALGFLAMFLNIQCTFNWSFADAFVICISWYLIARLKQVNNRIIAARGKYMPASFWKTMREDYCKATNLVRKVDDVINSVIFISFANNLFFICLQLLHLLEESVKPKSACGKPLETRPLKGYEHALYFLYSFGYLLARYIAVSLIAARVHTASKQPAQTLYDVPSATFCDEVQRFIDQIHGDSVALSGLKFFQVKRGLLLTVAGTIVTYELVLMQFTGISPTISPPVSLVFGPLATEITEVKTPTSQTDNYTQQFF